MPVKGLIAVGLSEQWCAGGHEANMPASPPARWSARVVFVSVIDPESRNQRETPEMEGQNDYMHVLAERSSCPTELFISNAAIISSPFRFSSDSQLHLSLPPPPLLQLKLEVDKVQERHWVRWGSSTSPSPSRSACPSFPDAAYSANAPRSSAASPPVRGYTLCQDYDTTSAHGLRILAPVAD